MKLNCPECQKSLTVAGEYAGKRAKCPNCRVVIQIPLAEESEPVDPWDGVDAEPMATGKPARMSARAHLETESGVSPGEKTCPMCGETIKANIRKCRFCGELLTGTDQPGKGGIWRDGNRLVMSKDAELLFVCVKTNQPATEWLRRKMYWRKRWVYMMLLAGLMVVVIVALMPWAQPTFGSLSTAGLLIFIIVAMIVRQKADIRVGLCAEQACRRRWAIGGSMLATVVGFVLILVGAAVGNPEDNSLLLFFLGGTITIFVAASVGWRVSRIVTPAKIDKQYVWLKGVHPDFLAALPEFPG